MYFESLATPFPRKLICIFVFPSPVIPLEAKSYTMNIRYLLLQSLLLFSISISGQTPTEQDCLGAIPLFHTVYYQDSSYTGSGNFPNEISTAGCPASCLLSGEKNDVWYIFTVQSTGNLCFNIIPNSSSDDYDWAVFNLTNASCTDIFSDSTLMVSCNYSATSGTTGANGLDSMICANASDKKNNAQIPVVSGETFVLNISNFSATQSGYTLDFSCTDTAIFTNNPTSDKPPGKSAVIYPNPAENEVSVMIESKIYADFCLSVFDLTGKQIMSTPLINESDNEKKSYRFSVASLPAGSYVVVIFSESGMFDRLPLMIIR